MISIIRNANIFAPEPLGVNDILVASGKVISVAKTITGVEVEGIQEVDASGMTVVPGFVDGHVHLIGGGGEGGFHTRTPEVQLSMLTQAGVTTVVGLLGTDGLTRHNESLFAKTKALNNEGVSAYMFTGGYQVPSNTITGEIGRDIMFVDTVIGLKTAVSDHRSSHPSLEELIRMISEARVAGMLSGKCGRVVIHLGGSATGFKPLNEVLNQSDIPRSQFIPTHVNRTRALMDEAMDWCREGGFIDITAGINPEKGASKGVKASKVIADCLEQKLDLDKICLSSDGNGSLPIFDDEGNMIRLGVAGFDCLLSEFKDMVLQEGISITEALRPLTSSPASCLGLSGRKGHISRGKDADFLILNEDLEIEYTIANGATLVDKRQLVAKGMFE